MTDRINTAQAASLLAANLGGGMMQARLRQKGWTDGDIAAECKRIMKEEAALISEWCGGELEKITQPSWKLSMEYHTAMRILNEREGVHGSTLDSIEQAKVDRKYSSVEPPVRAHQGAWEKDDLDDIDLGEDF